VPKKISKMQNAVFLLIIPTSGLILAETPTRNAAAMLRCRMIILKLLRHTTAIFLFFLPWTSILSAPKIQPQLGTSGSESLSESESKAHRLDPDSDSDTGPEPFHASPGAPLPMRGCSENKQDPSAVWQPAPTLRGRLLPSPGVPGGA